MFPRLKERGPIEAAEGRPRPKMRRTGFPRLKERGPIEAQQEAMGIRYLDQLFPRLKERGPIEATSSRGRTAPVSGVSTLERAWPH